uniref:Enoyl-CoA hydratase and 3-hydroxyacyl CoA dehydrogenase n=1 Tax=Latimeria chalumnae TaxID=7897 RepID=H3AX87_LATCH
GQPVSPRKVSGKAVQAPRNWEALLEESMMRLRKRSHGALSPLACVQAMRAAVLLPFPEGMKEEKRLMTVLITSGQAQAQQYLFFAERAVVKWTRSDGANWKTAQAALVQKAAVIGVGLGTMGRGIAVSLVKAGIPVIAVEADQKLLDQGKRAVTSLLKREDQKTHSKSTEKGLLELVSFTLDFHRLTEVDLVIETVFEDMSLKKDVFRKLSSLCKPGTFLCTNTSGLDIDEIASVTARPDLVVGTHFFAPAHVMKLLEVVYGRYTSATAIATAMKVGKKLNKIGVVVGNCSGFVGNRMMRPYVEQASFLIEEGSSPQEVDGVLEELGFTMGPFKTMDLSGLDVGWRSRKELGLTGPKLPPGTPFRQRHGKRYSPLPDILSEKGRYGQKSGKGWYQYEKPGGRIAAPDPWFQRLLEEYRKTYDIKTRYIDADEIIERCLYPLINEGFHLLDEGIASNPEYIDVIYVYGYGWPRHTGGPMFYAWMVGLPRVLEKLWKYQEAYPDILHLEPSNFLKKLVANGSPHPKQWKSLIGSSYSKL